MDQQHPVPQQISSYQFRLVGDMTLKQFFELAAGALLGLLIYASTLPTIIKWPIIIAFVLGGIAFAFLPVEDRPLEVWVGAFFRSIYSPTLYHWEKQQSPVKVFQDESVAAPPLGVISPGGEAELNKYLSEGAEHKSPFSSKLEEMEKGFLTKVTGLFGQFIPQAKPTESSMQQTVSSTQAPATPQQPQYQNIAVHTNTPNIAPRFSSPSIDKIVEENPKPMTSSVTIPKTEFLKVAPQDVKVKSSPVYEEPKTFTTAPIAPVITPQQTAATPQQTQQAEFSQSASPPMPPTQPNTISGQVMDSSGKIIEGAILEIKDAAGRPVRAVKTNKLGHFFIVTPLADGVYEIITEKDGFEFVNVKFNANGKLIPPIAVKANNSLTN
jgi:hypothetical protein